MLISECMFNNAQFMAKSLQEQSVGPSIRRWLGVFALLRTDLQVEVRLEMGGAYVGGCLCVRARWRVFRNDLCYGKCARVPACWLKWVSRCRSGCKTVCACMRTRHASRSA